ncbi:MAG TPA: hypothetical protein VEA37_02200 [Flavobacterium sp.]|nr:hypothetical protein [Flavobacterium sp.]
MKKKYLQFLSNGDVFIPGEGDTGTRLRFRRHCHFNNGGGAAAVETEVDEEDDEDDDNDEDDEPTKEERALLKKITVRMGKEFKKRGIKDKTSIAVLVANELKGLNMDELRKFGADQTAAIASVTKIAGELEKIKQRMTTGDGKAKINVINDMIEKRATDIEAIFKSKTKGKEVTFNVRAAAVMTTDNTIDETTNAIPADLIESFSIAEFVGKRFGRQYIYDIADRTVVAEIDQYKTWLEEGDEQGAFAIVAEGATKPLVSTALVRNKAEAKKVAGKYIITEEFAKFRKNAYNIIRNLVMDKLVRDYNALISTDFQGEAAGYTGTVLDGTITAPNDYDAIGAVAAQMETLNFIPDTLILHPQDKWRIRLTKDAEGRYLFPMTTENGMTIVLSLRLITSTYQTIGEFTLAEGGLYKIEEEPISVRIGYGITVTGASPVTNVVGDFDNNQLRVIVEMFFLSYLATPNVGSIVTAEFATVKAALAV